jgi:hypothetical protein
LLSEDVNAGLTLIDDHSLNLVIAVVRHELFHCHFDHSAVTYHSERGSLFVVIALVEEQTVFHTQNVTSREGFAHFNLLSRRTFVDVG